MKTRQTNFVLGLAVIMFLALFLGTILFIYPTLGYGTKQVVFYFEHEKGVAPLKPGSPVYLSGSLQVGKVTGVRSQEFTRPSGRQLMIVVEAEIDEKLELFEGCKITTNEPAVGGSGFVVILDVGTPDERRKLDLSRPILGLPPVSLAATISNVSLRVGQMLDSLQEMINKDVEGSLMNKIVASLDDVNAMTRTLKRQVSPREEATLMRKIHGVLDDLNAITAALRAQTTSADPASALAKVHAALDQLRGGFSEATAILQENRPALRNTMANLEQATRTVNDEILVALRAELNRDDPSALLGKLQVGLDQLNAALANVKSITEEGRKLIVLNRPALERTITNIRELSELAKATVQSIYLAPWRLTRPLLGEPQRTSVLEAARTFAEATTYLDDAAARLEAVVSASAAGENVLESRAEIESIQQSLRAAFERFERAEEFLWEKMK